MRLHFTFCGQELLLNWDYSTVEAISKIITQADERIKKLVATHVFISFLGGGGVLSPQNLKIMCFCPSQKRQCAAPMSSGPLSWRVLSLIYSITDNDRYFPSSFSLASSGYLPSVSQSTNRAVLPQTTQVRPIKTLPFHYSPFTDWLKLPLAVDIWLMFRSLKNFLSHNNCFSSQQVRMKEEKEILEHFAGVVSAP